VSLGAWIFLSVVAACPLSILLIGLAIIIVVKVADVVL